MIVSRLTTKDQPLKSIFVAMFKRGLLFITFSLVNASVSSLFAQLNEIDANGLKQGNWKKTYENGAIRYEGQFKDDKPSGLFKYFCKNGKLKATNNHLNDGISVAHHSYHENGKIKAKGVYKTQKKDSVWFYYNNAEILILEEGYKMDVLHGVQKLFYPSNGQLMEQRTFNDGLKHGEWLKYFEDGKKWLVANYENGELTGEFEMYKSDGKPELKGTYELGVRHGRWLMYNENGSVRTQDIYHQGAMTKQKRENGVFEEFYEDYRPKSSYTFKGGVENGEFREWYNNGQWVLKEEKGTKMGEPTEDVEELRGQTLKLKGWYVAGKLNGKLTMYYEDGTVERVEMYEMGELTSTIEWDGTNGK